MIWQFVKHFVSIVTFALSITYTYWTLADVRVKKGEHLENQSVTWTQSDIFRQSKSYYNLVLQTAKSWIPESNLVKLEL